MIALEGNDGLANFFNVLTVDVPEHIRQARESLRHSKGHAQPAACCKVKAKQFALFFDGNQANVVGKNIRVVLGRYGQRNFEFSGQIGFPINRFFVLSGGIFR